MKSNNPYLNPYTVELILKMEDISAGKLFKSILQHIDGMELDIDDVAAEAVFKIIKPKLNKALKKDNDDSIDWSSLKDYFIKVTGKDIRVVNETAKRQFRARLREGYTKKDIANAIKNCYNSDFHRETNHKYLTLEFISRAEKLDKYSTIKENKESVVVKQDKIKK